ncbi:MAG TPA: hypothetical protein PLH72_08795 [Vicinamibacterales bacterium]|nr:hypothetical protein [Vicinamibacterales bacterium]
MSRRQAWRIKSWAWTRYAVREKGRIEVGNLAKKWALSLITGPPRAVEP